jgi:hypothetical protein
MAAGLRITLNLESPIPAYRQIADEVRRHLVEERQISTALRRLAGGGSL